MATWNTVDTVVGTFPETTTGTSHGHRAWRMRKKLLVWERPLRKSDLKALGPTAPTGDIVGLPTADLTEKEELVAAFPTVFFTTPHFEGSSVVLARLDALPEDLLAHLVEQAWRRAAPKRVVAATDAAASDCP